MGALSELVTPQVLRFFCDLRRIAYQPLQNFICINDLSFYRTVLLRLILLPTAPGRLFTGTPNSPGELVALGCVFVGGQNAGVGSSLNLLVSLAIDQLPTASMKLDISV